VCVRGEREGKEGEREREGRELSRVGGAEEREEFVGRGDGRGGVIDWGRRRGEGVRRNGVLVEREGWSLVREGGGEGD